MKERRLGKWGPETPTEREIEGFIQGERLLGSFCSILAPGTASDVRPAWSSFEV
jgi:hypothetical protein